MKLKVGDNVVVITGKNKNKTGKILKIHAKTDRVVVEELNKVTRHVKKTKDRKGQKVQFEAPIHISNVMIIDPESKKRSRIGYKIENEKKVRIAKRSKSVLDSVSPKKAKK